MGETYRENIRYRETEKDILTFVSQQRRRGHRSNREQRRPVSGNRRARYRSLVQSAVYGIFRSTVDGRFLAVKPGTDCHAGLPWLGRDACASNVGRCLPGAPMDRENHS